MEHETKIKNLSQAYKLLCDSAPHLLEDVISSLCDTLAQTSPDSRQAAFLFFSLPEEIINNTLDGCAHEALTNLLEKAQPYFSSIAHIPGVVTKISPKSLAQLKAKGLDYDIHIQDNKAIKLWLLRGSAFGEKAWRKNHPRKNPVIALWEESGMIVPAGTLCEEGLTLIENTIQSFTEDKYTNKLRNTVHNKSIDPRILLAFLLSPSCPEDLKKPYTWRNAFINNEKSHPFADLFLPAQTAHGEMERQKRLAAGPSIREILTYQRGRLIEDLPKLFG